MIIKERKRPGQGVGGVGVNGPTPRESREGLFLKNFILLFYPAKCIAARRVIGSFMINSHVPDISFQGTQ